MENNIQSNIEDRVNQRIKDGIQYDFDKFFSSGWSIFKQVFLQVLGGILILSVPLIIISLILGPLLSGPSDLNPYDFKPGNDIDLKELFLKIQQQNSSPMYYLRQSILSFLAILISAPLQAGFLKLCREAEKDGPSFGDLFIYYKNEYTGRIVLAGLITTTLGTVTGLVFNFVPFFGPIINLLLTITFYLLFVFVVPLIIFGNASLGQAFQLSIKLTLNKFLAVLGLTLLFGILSISGLIVCCIGVLLTVAFMPVCNYLLYRFAVGFPEDDAEKDEEPHWQDQPPTDN